MRLLRAELRKAAATPATWWLLLATSSAGVLGTVAPLVSADGGSVGLLSERQLRTAMHGAAAGAVLVLVAGILGMAGEWRFGRASQTFLTTPRRSRCLAAKSVVYAGVGASYGVVAAISATITAWIWYRSKNLVLPLDRSAVWLTLAGCVLVATLFGVLGVGVGAIVRRPTAAIVGALAWTVLVEPALYAAAPRTFRWLPGIASLSLRRQPATAVLSPAAAAVVLAIVIGTALTVGARLVERDDVTG